MGQDQTLSATGRSSSKALESVGREEGRVQRLKVIEGHVSITFDKSGLRLMR